MKFLRRLLTLAVMGGTMVLGWNFAGSNSAPVTVNYLAGEFTEIALWMVVLISFALGGVLVALFAAVGRARAGLMTRRYRKTVAGLEAEVHQLRNLPLNPEVRALPEPAALVKGAEAVVGGSA